MGHYMSEFFPDNDDNVKTLDVGNAHTFDLDKHPRALGAEIDTTYEHMVETDAAREQFAKTAKLSRTQVRYLNPGSLTTSAFIVTTNRVILEQVKAVNVSANYAVIITNRYRQVVAIVQPGEYLQNLDIECDGLHMYAVANSADLISFSNGGYWAPGAVITAGDTNTAALIYFREIV